MDKVKLAESFLTYNVNFYYDVAEEYFEVGNWKAKFHILKEEKMILFK
ncbi:MAG: hypothetical protein N4A64_12670 [Marinisporobacter sp.]|nr:hypothetical protein [Marinisporobacter sp.]